MKGHAGSARSHTFAGAANKRSAKLFHFFTEGHRGFRRFPQKSQGPDLPGSDSEHSQGSEVNRGMGGGGVGARGENNITAFLLLLSPLLS